MARIVFDLDGTLVESAPTIAEAANRLLAELGRAPLPIASVLAFVGHGMPSLVARVLAETGGVPGGDLAPHVARYREIYGEDPVTGTVAYDHVSEALGALAAAGHGLAVCTQKADLLALAVLRSLDLMPPITALAGGDSVGVLKPDPRMFHFAADQLGDGPAVMVGDSETDAATARAAGVPFLLRRGGYHHGPEAAMAADGAFDDFRELPGLIEAVLAR